MFKHCRDSLENLYVRRNLSTWPLSCHHVTEPSLSPSKWVSLSIFQPPKAPEKEPHLSHAGPRPCLQEPLLRAFYLWKGSLPSRKNSLLKTTNRSRIVVSDFHSLLERARAPGENGWSQVHSRNYPVGAEDTDCVRRWGRRTNQKDAGAYQKALPLASRDITDPLKRIINAMD